MYLQTALGQCEDECWRGTECRLREHNGCEYFHRDQREFELNRYSRLSDTEKQLLHRLTADLTCISAPKGK